MPHQIKYNVVSGTRREGIICTDSSTVICASNTIQYNFHGIWCTAEAVVNIIDNFIHTSISPKERLF